MWRATVCASFALLSSAAAGGCLLLVDVDGLNAGADAAPPDAGPAAADSATTAPDDGAAPTEDAATSGVYRPRFQRLATVTNADVSELPTGSTQCFLHRPSGSALLARTRSDLGDLRVFGATSERPRVVEARGNGFFSFCFSLERAIAAGASDEYAFRYGDPDASPPPPAEALLFAFWEPFDGAAVDRSRWLVNGSVTVGGGMAVLPKGSPSALTTTAALDPIPALASLEIRARVVDPSSGGKVESDGGPPFYYWLGFQRQGDFVAAGPWALFIARSPGSVRAEQRTAAGACAATCSARDAPQSSEFRVYRVDRGSARTVFTDDESAVFVAEGTNGDESIMLRNYLVTSDVVVDWVRARPSAATAPGFQLADEEPLP
jgi:hypothetical protein